ncbi:hypothetical protein PoB_007075800 [Plakobranchus ocellatus]|uniref:Uncharacterized protein n=1 Tax=Plakobranchus ocellatus TaxID=259542 RepID=A0AAV4DJ05_9GAST|nr:hypothetical protein PoB_007075800 [Plakobranchus ocellatus]
MRRLHQGFRECFFPTVDYRRLETIQRERFSHVKTGKEWNDNVGDEEEKKTEKDNVYDIDDDDDEEQEELEEKEVEEEKNWTRKLKWRIRKND